MKNPILSKTIQGILLAVLPHFLAKLGLKFDEATTQGLVEEILMAVGGLWGIYGRCKAEVPINNPFASSKLPLLLLAAGLVSGCASINQTATSSIAPDGTEERRVESRVFAIGDSKQTVDRLNTSSGKTLTAGAKGAEQESSTESLKTLVELLRVLAPAAKP